jgi:hypothetical protein
MVKLIQDSSPLTVRTKVNHCTVQRGIVSDLYLSKSYTFIPPKFTKLYSFLADPSGRAVLGVVMRPLACCDCGFESHGAHRYIYVVNVVCFQVEVSASG